jgi:hypothetical protein
VQIVKNLQCLHCALKVLKVMFCYDVNVPISTTFPCILITYVFFLYNYLDAQIIVICLEQIALQISQKL